MPGPTSDNYSRFTENVTAVSTTSTDIGPFGPDRHIEATTTTYRPNETQISIADGPSTAALSDAAGGLSLTGADHATEDDTFKDKTADEQNGTGDVSARHTNTEG